MEATLAMWLEAWRRTRALTYDLLAVLPYAVMNFSPHPEFGTLIRQIRHVGDIQACYLAAIETGTMDFRAQQRQRRLESSKEDVEAYLRHLDARLQTILASPDAAARTVAWDDGAVPLLVHLTWLLQHETLHQGMWAFYAKVAELPLPGSWQRVWALR